MYKKFFVFSLKDGHYIYSMYLSTVKVGSDHGARATEAADAPRPADDPAAPCRPAARALCYGRPALGGSVHAGVSQHPGRSRSHRPSPGAVDLSSGLPPPVDGSLASHTGDPAALAAAPGGRDNELDS